MKESRAFMSQIAKAKTAKLSEYGVAIFQVQPWLNESQSDL